MKDSAAKSFWQSGQRDKKFEGFSSFGKPGELKKKTGKEKRGAGVIEDQYINNLQQQIYFLELQMKLLKDREVESKQKAAGFEHLMKDGIPLNEHFIALKNKYNTEMSEYEQRVKQLEEEIRNIEKDNEGCKQRIAILNQEYADVEENYNKFKDNSTTDIRGLELKLYNETNTGNQLREQKESNDKILQELRIENTHLKRTIEKNKMFVKSKVDPVRVETEKRNKLDLEKAFEEIKKQDLAHQQLKKDAVGNQLQKRLEDQNVELIQQLNRFERDMNISRSKLNQLESLREMNMRYLVDEAMQNAKLTKENQRLQNEIDFKQKMDEEDRRKIVAQTEFKNSRTLQNSVKYDQERTNTLLEMLRDQEERGKALLDQRMNRNQELIVMRDDIKFYSDDETGEKHRIIQLKDQIDSLQKLLEQQKEEDAEVTTSVTQLEQNNEDLDRENEELRKKLQNYLQQIDINNLLRDVDTDEVRILAQNNSLVNQTIHRVMERWDNIEQDKSAV